MKALITGITGQDGSYLTEFLLSKGYEVHGIIRRSSSFNTSRIDHLYKDPHIKDCKLFLHYGDMVDASSLFHIINDVRPDEIYNLAAQSHVRVSFDIPDYTGDVDALGVLRLLDAIRSIDKNIKFYQASTSELYGDVLQIPQSEITPFNPQSPYAIAKLYAYWICKNYRKAYNMFICNGILFNHESPRRGETFVTRKITRGLSRMEYGLQNEIYLGNIESKRDWGHAKDYVEGMWLMLQQNKPDDYVLATGVQHSIKEFIKECLEYCPNIKYRHPGDYIKIDSKYFRPTEVNTLLGCADKAKARLGWTPKISFQELVKDMMEHDLLKAQNEYNKQN